MSRKKERNLWPYGILSVIVLGIVLIAISIRISVKHPVSDDRPFFLNHNDTDSAINTMLADTKYIQEHFNFYIQANITPTQDNVLRLYSQYLRPPYKGKPKNDSPNILLTKSLNTLQLLAKPIDGDVKDLKITGFIQKIGQSPKQEIFIFNPNDNSFTSSKPEKDGEQIHIGDFALLKDDLFLSPSFELEAEGRWIVSLQITYKDKTIVLEKEFFAIQKDTTQNLDQNLESSIAGRI